jgi:tripartite-type tricarboxylate transporter receptor subunit TctC
MRLTPFSISLPFALSAMVLATAAMAQTAPGGYPSRPIKMVVPAAQGSLTDPVARVIAEAMKQRTGQPWIVENRPGAGGVIGSDAVARSEPDGYSLLFTANNFLISPAMYKNVPYKVRESFGRQQGLAGAIALSAGGKGHGQTGRTGAAAHSLQGAAAEQQ